MSFSITSVGFLLFLSLTVLLYYVVPKRLQWICLLVCSFGFYLLTVGVQSLPLLFLGVAISYLGARGIEKSFAPAWKRAILIISIVLLTALLVSCKLWLNLIQSPDGLIYRLLHHWVDFSGVSAGLSIMAPLGMSYYTLSAIGYLLDVYWGKCAPQKNAFRFALFLTYFPQMVSGPIVRYHEQERQLFAERRFNYVSVKFGFERILYGLLKKLVIADRIASVPALIFADTATYPGFYILVGVLLYALQIYADFSGCMDILLGASEMLQIRLPENFKRPFFSQNLSEFWRRWHITLGLWAKDYLLYPILKTDVMAKLGSVCKKKLGKKAGKNIPTYLGLLIIWAVIGIWHGGSAKYFVAAGILPWILLVSGQLLQPCFDWITRTLRINKACFSYRLFSRIRTLLLMCIIWLFALPETFFRGRVALVELFSCWNPWILMDGSLYLLGIDAANFFVLFLGLIMMLIVSILQEKGYQIRACLARQNMLFQWLILLGMIFAILIFGIYGPGYNPVDFIYAGF